MSGPGKRSGPMPRPADNGGQDHMIALAASRQNEIEQARYAIALADKENRREQPNQLPADLNARLQPLLQGSPVTGNMARLLQALPQAQTPSLPPATAASLPLRPSTAIGTLPQGRAGQQAHQTTRWLRWDSHSLARRSNRHSSTPSVSR